VNDCSRFIARTPRMTSSQRRSRPYPSTASTRLGYTLLLGGTALPVRELGLKWVPVYYAPPTHQCELYVHSGFAAYQVYQQPTRIRASPLSRLFRLS